MSNFIPIQYLNMSKTVKESYGCKSRLAMQDPFPSKEQVTQ